MSFDTRKKQIINEFLKHQKPITGRELAKLVGVSSRTIRNYIKILNKELKNKEIQITSMPSIGYRIMPDGDETIAVLKAYAELEEVQISLLPDERMFYIVNKFLKATEPITTFELSKELYVSKSTIDNDLIKVSEWFIKNNLELVKKANSGMSVNGTEFQIRYSISDYFIKGYYTKYGNNILFQKMEEIRNIILKVSKNSNLELSDISIENLVIHIAVAIERIYDGNSVDLPLCELSNLQKKLEYEIATSIVMDLQNAFQIEIPENEKAYITIHLLGVKALNYEKCSMLELEKLVGKDLLQLIYRMIDRLDEIYKLNIGKDDKLIYSLAMHLKPALNRFKYNMNLRNPLLKEIKENYPHAFEMGVEMSRVLEECIEVKINENEIGYMAMHIGAALERKIYLDKDIKRVVIICASGMGTAQLIASRIGKAFSNIEIVGIYPSYKIEEAFEVKPDLIITTVDIDSKDIPMIRIRSILGKSDLENIGSLIKSSENISHKVKTCDLFDENLYVQNISSKDRYKVIEILSNKLYEQNCVNEFFMDSVVEREEISATSISNLVAIPHAIFENVLKSRIAIGILDKPIIWGDNKVQLVLLLALKKMTDKELRDIFDTLFSILDDEISVSNLIKANCFDEFIKFIK